MKTPKRLSPSAVLYESANDPRTANDPGPQMYPNWTANDPGPQLIPILDRKWSRPKNKEWHGLILKSHTEKHIFLFYKKYSIVVVIFFVFCWKCETLRDVLFCLFQDLLSNWFRKSTCCVEHPRTSENMRNRILLLLYMNNTSAVHVWFQWKSGKEYKTRIPMKNN